MHPPILSYRYRVRPFWMCASVILFGFAAVSLFDAASKNNRGMVIGHIVHLSASEATGVYWLLAACSVAFATLALYALALRYTRPRYVTLGNETFSFPKGYFSKTQITLRLDEIDEIYIQSAGQQSFITLKTQQGKYDIPGLALPNNEAFDTLYYKLTEAVEKS